MEIPEISIKKSSELGGMKNHIPQKFELKQSGNSIFKPYKLASPFLQTYKLEELTHIIDFIERCFINLNKDE